MPKPPADARSLGKCVERVAWGTWGRTRPCKNNARCVRAGRALCWAHDTERRATRRKAQADACDARWARNAETLARGRLLAERLGAGVVHVDGTFGLALPALVVGFDDVEALLRVLGR